MNVHRFGVGAESMMSQSEGSMRALLQPRSIALVGASDRQDTLGRAMVDMARVGGYGGSVYAINPKYREIDGMPCFGSIAELPEMVDHVVLGVGNERLEAALDDAIAHGARAATIFASCGVHGDGGKLRESLATKARAAGMSICGGNCMGFYNNEIGLRVAGYPALQAMEPGSIGWLAQSGSVFGALAHNDERLKFNVAISSGAELVTTAADYLRWMADHENIRVVGMFLESVRDPAGFAAALELAATKDVPVVILKVGRTAASAEMALSHTGAIAGSDAAYTALFKRYGAIQVDDEDELAATLTLFQYPRRPGRGGLVAIHDSGGERELAADIADAVGVTYPQLSESTKDKIGTIIDSELIPANPLDAWGGARDFRSVFTESFTALVEDDSAAIGMMFCDIRDGYYVSNGFVDATISTHRCTEKPVALVTNYSMVNHRELVLKLTSAGVPVIDGTRVALKAVKNMLYWRDRQRLAGPQRPSGCGGSEIVQSWRMRLAEGSALSEREALSLMADYGIATAKSRAVAHESELAAVAEELSFPVVLKTAASGILHKSDVGGVVLNIKDSSALHSAYRAMSDKLGLEALVSEMVPKGIELALGAIFDPQWGPVVVISAGGVLMELLDDSAAALGPISYDEAAEMIASLKISKLLDGYRGTDFIERDKLIDSLVRLSWLANDFSGCIGEIDVNPLIVNVAGCVAVDALVLPMLSDRGH
ncbi:acetate--CoA ligase family protein [Rhizobium pusense]|uniref:acetate--CoA ligase family protein n=1 Tax=Agrobacterium pusense TaxID=648995 RepID=UPI00244C549A|nr:acetate--CoA ligase family protein [Agrobacterium pusense]MDH1099120.1 acetate--CoA ligase family protein [Agrobacterium pusense]MDH1115704.1 acetate--CoA ligase family protein [Agrobacterium pusense]MDH2197465.1 acetate--CoA ligase family protein [Agrobacterium pusense]